MVKKALLIIMLLFVMLSAIGCQTVQGIGGDIRWLAGARDNPSGARHNYSDTRDNYSGSREDY